MGGRALAWTPVAAALALGGCGDAGEPERGGPEAQRAPAAGLGRVEVVASDLDAPWGVAFLPDGSALVGEKDSGRILRVVRRGGRPRVVARVPGVVAAAGEGGLLGLAVSPAYRRDGLVYAYFTGARDNRIVRLRLGGRHQPVLSGLARSGIHNGGRIAFGPDGMLYVGTGDAGDGAVSQDRASLNGKILRLRPDGGVPADNPFAGSPVFTLGHRNVQGLAWDRRGRLWASEFGQDTFDEVNLIRPGGNYGWPEVEGRGDTRGTRFTNPVVTWSTPEASPSGAAIAGETLYVAALRGERLWRVPLRDTGAGRPQALLQGRFGRLRTVVVASDGALWLTTSNRDRYGDPRSGDDRLLRIARR